MTTPVRRTTDSATTDSPTTDNDGGRPAGGGLEAAEHVVMQRENERARVVLDGRRTDDGTRCTLIVIHEYGGTLALYPHGAGALGVRLSRADAAAVARFCTAAISSTAEVC